MKEKKRDISKGKSHKVHSESLIAQLKGVKKTDLDSSEVEAKEEDLEEAIDEEAKHPHKKASHPHEIKTSHEKEKQKIDRYKDQSPNTEFSRSSLEEIRKAAHDLEMLRKEISKAVIGQKVAVDGLIRGLLCDGHVLLEGVPGIAKTLLILTLGSATGATAKRIQFTVDLLPSDIIGITTYTPTKGFEVIKGPIFTNFIIADEINRSPPKTQSALLEAMQEKKVTIGKKTYDLPRPFFVMATENPIETSGVYFLPEAQIDRFLFKVLMGYPEKEEEKMIMKRNISLFRFEDLGVRAVMNPGDIVRMQKLVMGVYASKEIEEYIVRIVGMTRSKDATEYNKYVEMGGSPRAAIGIYIASKAEALINGRNFVIPNDVKAVAPDVLRHRIILNYLAQSEKITTDIVIKKILDVVEIP